ncbi:MAG: NAD-dependent epimerase/dehydratase family protein [Chitinophagaceae bacterium]|nr:NAD-dependent epimerase/dehydratase family protein [Chitinophagaceae bacterium]
MKHILVTGATGFIGNHVIKTLLENNCRVTATSVNEEKASHASWYPLVQYIPFDLKHDNDSIDLFRFFGEPDAVIHLAWEGLPNYKSAFHLEENLPRHLAFLSNLIRHGLKDLTVTGTCFEYGMKEGCLSEDQVPEPANPYAQAKDELRRQLDMICEKEGVQFKWVRLFYMYGEGQGPNSLISQLDKALAENQPVFNMSGGEQVRDFLPVKDVAANLVAIALQKSVSGIINCCSGKPVTVKSFVENYLKERHKQITLNLGYYPYTDYEAMRFWGDNTKLKSILHHD